MTGLRILTIASELPPVRSGVARSAGRVADGLEASGHSVDRLSSADAWRRHIGEFRFSALGVRFMRIGPILSSYDIVHVHGPAPFISDAFLLRWATSRRGRRSTRLVYTHGFTLELDGLERLCAGYDRVTGPLLRCADAVTVTSASYAGVARRHGARRVEVIPWGVDPPGHDPEPCDYDGRRKLRLAFVGQQRPYKGIDVLVDAVAGLGAVELVVIGGGPGLESVRRRIDTRRATNITHLGSVEDSRVAEVLATSDAVVLPSTNRSEAFGLVLLEGMTHGCVPVASDLPGVDDLVGEVGILVRPGDPTALRRALLELATHPDRVRALSAEALDRSRHYRWTRTVASFDALFADLVGSQP